MTPISLFEREMRAQVAAARSAVTEAEGRTDPLLLQAARNQLDSLLSLARRNGLTFDAPDTDVVLEPAVVPTG